jgi:hypothetical protein
MEPMSVSLLVQALMQALDAAELAQARVQQHHHPHHRRRYL